MLPEGGFGALYLRNSRILKTRAAFSIRVSVASEGAAEDVIGRLRHGSGNFTFHRDGDDLSVTYAV